MTKLEINENTDELNVLLCGWIRSRRIELGLTQLYLADLCGINHSYLSQIELCKRKRFCVPMLLRILMALDSKLVLSANDSE